MSLVTPILNSKIFFSLARKEQNYKNECAEIFNKCKDKPNCKVGEESPHYSSYSLHASLPPILPRPNTPSGQDFLVQCTRQTWTPLHHLFFQPRPTLQSLLVLRGFIRSLLSVKSVIISSNSSKRNHNVTMKTIASVECTVSLCCRHSSSILHPALHLILTFTDDEIEAWKDWMTCLRYHSKRTHSCLIPRVQSLNHC